MWSTILSFVFSKTGLYAGLALALFLAGFIVCWKLCHRGASTFESTQTVVSAANGATLNVKAGLLDRSTRPLFLAGISAPGLNDSLGTQSRDNLLKLAGGMVRVESTERPIGAKPLVGQCFGSTGQDLAIAQLTAGLATCETGATKEQIAAQKAAQAAQRGLWAHSGGSHWWNFTIATAADWSDSRSPVLTEASTPMLDYGLILEVAVLATVALWIFWYLFGPTITAQFSGATAVTSAVTNAVDVSQETAAYVALSGIRYMPNVAANPQAVAACETLLSAVMVWPKS